MVLIHNLSKLGWLTVSPLRVEGSRKLGQSEEYRASRTEALYCKTPFFASRAAQLCRSLLGVPVGSQSRNNFCPDH